MQSLTYVFLAGIDNSGPEHWQSHWRGRVADSVWVEHASWDAPVRDTWVEEFDDALRKIEGPKILVAHSLGCTLVAEWAAQHQDAGIVGAFLVAVPDARGPAFPSAAVGFDPARHGRLPFPCLVVASEDDPYCSMESAAANAELFGAALVNVGRKGHLNAGSGLGNWPEGWSLFSEHFLS
ncbi:alpha/beta hydrolase [Actinocrinis puniceicyclus]|uniref:Alpha/beta hydrolase n=1 Tax=Actinocrinis puniceicyclus TaxID=977794 RepID=A0A8J7WKP0_9ACTN|nr:alpha/beta hydrolase [Actinocrinis puniceicyclus]MBS2961887.1 alpha/beta hydrolase [Actinocrinis puniceicyclus]